MLCIAEFVGSLVRSFFRSCFRSCVVRWFVGSLARSLARSFVRLFVHSSIRSFGRSCVRAVVRSFCLLFCLFVAPYLWRTWTLQVLQGRGCEGAQRHVNELLRFCSSCVLDSGCYLSIQIKEGQICCCVNAGAKAVVMAHVWREDSTVANPDVGRSPSPSPFTFHPSIDLLVLTRQ